MQCGNVIHIDHGMTNHKKLIMIQLKMILVIQPNIASPSFCEPKKLPELVQGRNPDNDVPQRCTNNFMYKTENPTCIRVDHNISYIPTYSL